jgi:hypothetical protein
MIDVKDIQTRLAGELSVRARIGYAGLFAISLLMASGVAALLFTEIDLPGRARAAFVLLIVIGVSWAAFAGWMLARRRVLLAAHRVLAARMALICCSVYTIACIGLGVSGQASAGAFVAAAIGAGQTALAALLYVQARRGVDALVARRRALEARMAAEGVPFRKDGRV